MPDNAKKSKEMQSGEDISIKQEKLLAFLLTEKTIEEACRKANVNITTYWRWMKDKNFLREYRQLRRGIRENAVAKLQSMTHEAIETLQRNLHCEIPSIEIRCAQIILEQSIKGMEALETERRLDSIEEGMSKLERLMIAEEKFNEQI